MPRLNPRISVYWLWLAIAFGAIAIVPWHPCQKMGPVRYLPLASAYVNDLFADNWQRLLIGHAALSAVLATCIAVVHRLFLSRRGRSEPTTFSLRGLFATTGVVALILGTLRWCGADRAVLFIVVIFLAGYATTFYLSGILGRRRREVPHTPP